MLYIYIYNITCLLVRVQCAVAAMYTCLSVRPVRPFIMVSLARMMYGRHHHNQPTRKAAGPDFRTPGGKLGVILEKPMMCLGRVVVGTGVVDESVRSLQDRGYRRKLGELLIGPLTWILFMNNPGDTKR